MSSWYSQIEKTTTPIFQAICQHDFIQQLTGGSLDKSRFEFYIQQDTLYLSVYKKLLAEIGSRCDDDQECQFYLNSACGVLVVEQALHQMYIKSHQAEISPTCELYTSYLAKMVFTQDLAVAMAAVLPCFTIYKAVGDFILAQAPVENNPYQSWINTYGGEEFANSTAKAIAITNRHAAMANAETLAKMEQAFVQASKLEWMFWDSAFKQEKWMI